MQSDFKKFLIRYLLPVLLLLTAAGWLTSLLFQQYVILGVSNNGSYKINRIIHQTDSIEIPIFGSSRAEGSFVPSLMGKQFFNYGVSGSQDDVLLFFLNEEVKKKKTTPIIINFDMEGLDSCLGDITNFIYNSDYAPVKQLLGKEYKTRYAIPFLCYYGKYENYFKLYLNSKMEATKITDCGGNFEKNVLSSKMFQAEITERINGSTIFNNDERYEKRLDSIITTHPNRQFIIILSPYHYSYFVSYHNAVGLNDYIKHLQSFNNVRLIDMSRMPYPDSLYFNTTHLNYAGAQLFSKQLRDSLKQLRITLKSITN